MDKAQQFWDWFKENEIRFLTLNQINDDEEREYLLDEFLANLHIYSDNLFFEMGGFPNEKQDLIITAGGDVDFFDQVELLVNQAPQLEHWDIIAFKPAVKEGGVIEYNNIELDPKTMFFIPLESKASPKIGLRIYADNYNSIEKDDFLTAAYLLLDTILGEKSSVLDIGYVEINSLPSVPEREELIEFTELPGYIKWKKSKLNA